LNRICVNIGLKIGKSSEFDGRTQKTWRNLLTSRLIYTYLICSIAINAYGNPGNLIPFDIPAGPGNSYSASDTVRIIRSWELPGSLKNISAIEYLQKGKLACLQEEIGSIFIFNLETGRVEKEIPFGPPGDYEGLEIIGTAAYVACADGRILEIQHYSSQKRTLIEHGSHLTVEENVNGLCYDRKNKRLLVTVKAAEDGSQAVKGIYAFILATRVMAVKPVIDIDLKDSVFSGLQPKNVQSVFQPSDLDINPKDNQVYIIDGTRGQLLRIRSNGAIIGLAELDKTKIFQPEGITFTPSGEIYLASKGVRDEPGMLLKVRMN